MVLAQAAAILLTAAMAAIMQFCNDAAVQKRERQHKSKPR